jgi:hypothetical protein
MATSAPSQGRTARLEYLVLLPWIWLRRSRGWRRRVLQLTYLLVALVVGLFGWRAFSLSGLPDVGDPFDVAAFERGRIVPESENAFVLYRRAEERISTRRMVPDPAQLWGNVCKGWNQAAPEIRAWAEENRPALEIWRQGTERPQASLVLPKGSKLHADLPLLRRLDALAGGAVLEGTRLQQAGDMAAAWRWYRAAMRFAFHLRQHLGIWSSYLADQEDSGARKELIVWARDPRTGPALLSQALNEVAALHERTPPVSQGMKAEYVALMHALDDPEALMSDFHEFVELRRGYLILWFLKREPERSRRVTRLVFANRLAQCDKPLKSRPPRGSNDPRDWGWDLYQADPAAPYAARAVPPKKLLEWKMSTSLVWRFLPGSFDFYEESARNERQGRAVLIVTLAEEFHQRERGTMPQSIDALVGPYLKALPEGYLPPDNDTTPSSPDNGTTRTP